MKTLMQTPQTQSPNKQKIQITSIHRTSVITKYFKPTGDSCKKNNLQKTIHVTPAANCKRKRALSEDTPTPKKRKQKLHSACDVIVISDSEDSDQEDCVQFVSTSKPKPPSNTNKLEIQTVRSDSKEEVTMIAKSPGHSTSHIGHTKARKDLFSQGDVLPMKVSKPFGSLNNNNVCKPLQESKGKKLAVGALNGKPSEGDRSSVLCNGGVKARDLHSKTPVAAVNGKMQVKSVSAKRHRSTERNIWDDLFCNQVDTSPKNGHKQKVAKTVSSISKQKQLCAKKNNDFSSLKSRRKSCEVLPSHKTPCKLLNSTNEILNKGGHTFAKELSNYKIPHFGSSRPAKKPKLPQAEKCIAKAEKPVAKATKTPSLDFDMIVPDDICHPFSDDSTDIEDNADELPEFLGNRLPSSVMRLKVSENNSQRSLRTPTYLDSPNLDLNDSLSSSQESNCSVTTVLKTLQSAALIPIPLTPRKDKKHGRLVNEDILSDNPQSEGSDIPLPKRKKISYTLNRLVKDHKNNEELRAMEGRLLHNIKKGGVSRFINDSSSDDDFDQLEDMDDQAKTAKIMSMMFHSKDDCLGLPEKHPYPTVFDPRLHNRFYCEHSALRHKQQGTNKELEPSVFLRNLKTGRIKYIAADDQRNASLPSTLIKILATSDDDVIRRSAYEAFKVFLSASSFYCDVTLCQMDEAVQNLGVVGSCFTPAQRPDIAKRVICKRCKATRFNPSTAWSKLHGVIKLLTLFCAEPRAPLTDPFVTSHLRLCCHLLAANHPPSMTYDIGRCVTSLVRRASDWQNVIQQLTSDIVDSLTDLPTLEALVSLLPASDLRCVHLRRMLARSGVRRCVGGDSNTESPPIAIDDLDLKPIAAYAKTISVAKVTSFVTSMRPSGVTRRQVFHVLFCCVSLLQVCVGNGAVPKLYKSQLESIALSLRSLSVLIRDNGSLYTSELKNFLRLLVGKMELQLQAMPKPRSYQQNIFKFLNSSRVDEQVVADSGAATDGSDDAADHDDVTNGDDDVTATKLGEEKMEVDLPADKELLHRSETLENDPGLNTIESGCKNVSSSTEPPDNLSSGTKENVSRLNLRDTSSSGNISWSTKQPDNLSTGTEDNLSGLNLRDLSSTGNVSSSTEQTDNLSYGPERPVIGPSKAESPSEVYFQTPQRSDIPSTVTTTPLDTPTIQPALSGNSPGPLRVPEPPDLDWSVCSPQSERTTWANVLAMHEKHDEATLKAERDLLKVISEVMETELVVKASSSDKTPEFCDASGMAGTSGDPEVAYLQVS